ncbi:hypothetical protein D3C76_1558480 [compost metagenome]
MAGYRIGYRPVLPVHREGHLRVVRHKPQLFPRAHAVEINTTLVPDVIHRHRIGVSVSRNPHHSHTGSGEKSIDFVLVTAIPLGIAYMLHHAPLPPPMIRSSSRSKNSPIQTLH